MHALCSFSSNYHGDHAYMEDNSTGFQWKITTLIFLKQQASHDAHPIITKNKLYDDNNVKASPQVPLMSSIKLITLFYMFLYHLFECERIQLEMQMPRHNPTHR